MTSQKELKKSFCPAGNSRVSTRPSQPHHELLLFLLGRHRQPLLLFEKVCWNEKENELLSEARETLNEPCLNARGLTCYLHLSIAAVLFTARSDRLGFDGHDLVVILLLRLDLFDVVIVAQFRQLPLKAAGVLSDRVESFDVIYPVDFRHIARVQRFPLVALLDLCRLSELEIKFPARRCFRFTTASGFDVSKKLKGRNEGFLLRIGESRLTLSARLCLTFRTKISISS